MLRFIYIIFLFCSVFALDKKIEVVYHIATLNQWKLVVEDQLQALKDSKLAEECNHITLTIVGKEFEEVKKLSKKYLPEEKTTLIHSSFCEKYCEFPGIDQVKKIAARDPDTYVLYIHSKGVSYQDSDKAINTRSWRRYLDYFTISLWKTCVEHLKNHDSCSVEWLNDLNYCISEIVNPGFYAGNFWWARGDYIQTCPDIWLKKNDPEWAYSHRFDCERFIGWGKNHRPKTLHQSGVNLYSFNYTPEYYKDALEVNLNPRIELIYYVTADKKYTKNAIEQLLFLESLPLKNQFDRLTIVAIGPYVDQIKQCLKSTSFDSKTSVIAVQKRVDFNEFSAIELIKQIAKQNPNAKICYFNNLKEDYSLRHKKQKSFLQELFAKSKKSIKNIFFTQKEYRLEVLSNWETCLSQLNYYDVCGGRWLSRDPKGLHFPDNRCFGHFKDNCFWVNASFVTQCHDPHFRSPYSLHHSFGSKKWIAQFFADCNMFIGTGDPKAFSVNQSLKKR